MKSGLVVCGADFLEEMEFGLAKIILEGVPPESGFFEVEGQGWSWKVVGEEKTTHSPFEFIYFWLWLFASTKIYEGA
ncbi:MAG: hypothetical protein AAB316_08225 [Bacteroidota bacterium]